VATELSGPGSGAGTVRPGGADSTARRRRRRSGRPTVPESVKHRKIGQRSADTAELIFEGRPLDALVSKGGRRFSRPRPP
jgi:hypothetical protein